MLIPIIIAIVAKTTVFKKFKPSEMAKEPKMALNAPFSRLCATSPDQAVLRRFLFADGGKLVTA